MAKKFTKTIGIVGGSGPAATAYAFSRLINICQSDYGSVQDEEFPNVIIANLPLSELDETGASGSEAKIKVELNDSYKLLKTSDVDLVYMACNTLHSYRPNVTDLDLTEVNAIKLSSALIKKLNPKASVSVLCSITAQNNNLYSSVLEADNLQVNKLAGSINSQVEKLILSGMSGKNLTKAKSELMELCQQLIKESDFVILGCTELSMLADIKLSQKDGLVDPQEIALRQLLEEAK